MSILQAPAAQHNTFSNFSGSTLAVWDYLSGLWIRHTACPRAGVRPRVDTIATAVGKTRRTVFRALAQLEQAGILRRDHRYRANHEQASSLYVLHHLYRRPAGQMVHHGAPMSDPTYPDNGQCMSHVDNLALDVDNPPDNPVDNLAAPPPPSYDIAPDVTPLEDSPKGNTISLNKAKDDDEMPAHIALHWNRNLQRAYRELIYHPWDPDAATFAAILQDDPWFTHTLRAALPPQIDWNGAILHLAARLAALAGDDTTVVNFPARWIAGYVRRLIAQGAITKGAPR